MSAPAQVVLATMPSLTTSGLVTAEPGENARLACTLEGEELLRVEWQRDGEAVTPGGRWVVETFARGRWVESSLRVTSVQEEDYGVYTCSASWEGGRVEGEVELVAGSWEELVVVQVVATSLGILTCLLCLGAAVRLGCRLRRGLSGRESQK